ncbi:unnamed protein product, partial [Polarella glacialis]
ASAAVALWDCSSSGFRRNDATIRAEADSFILVAGDGPTLGWPGWGETSRYPGTAEPHWSQQPPESGPSVGNGMVVWLDVSGACPAWPLALPVKSPPASSPSLLASAGLAAASWPGLKARISPPQWQQRKPQWQPEAPAKAQEPERSQSAQLPTFGAGPGPEPELVESETEAESVEEVAQREDVPTE